MRDHSGHEHLPLQRRQGKLLAASTTASALISNIPSSGADRRASVVGLSGLRTQCCALHKVRCAQDLSVRKSPPPEPAKQPPSAASGISPTNNFRPARERDQFGDRTLHRLGRTFTRQPRASHAKSSSPGPQLRIETETIGAGQSFSDLAIAFRGPSLRSPGPRRDSDMRIRQCRLPSTAAQIRCSAAIL